MMYLLSLLVALSLLLWGIVRLKIHPFYVLLMVAIVYGLMSGMSLDLIIESINEGFGGILGKIGLLILFGVTLGVILEKSGGAMVIANRILKVIGQKSIELAMMVTGYFLSIPVFADSALLMMNALNKTLTFKAKASFAATTAALAIGLTASHVLVPPTPGPIAAAGILGANLGQVILWGIVVSALALAPCYWYIKKFVSKIQLPLELEEIKSQTEPPKLWVSLLSLIIPIFLIILKSILEYPNLAIEENFFISLIYFLGNPIIALLIGVLLALLIPKKLDAQIYSASGWFGEALTVAAPIILITGAGGIFGKMLQNSGIAEAVSSSISDLNMGLLLPFILAAGLKTTQGSSTVALVTTASIVLPLVPVLGLDSDTMRVMTVLAIGAGSSVASHVNDSFFWVITQLTGMNVKQGYQIQSAGTFIFGLSAMAIILLITQFL